MKFNPEWVTSAFSMKAIYDRGNGDTTAPLEIAQHAVWTRKGFIFLRLASEQDEWNAEHWEYLKHFGDLYDTRARVVEVRATVKAEIEAARQAFAAFEAKAQADVRAIESSCNRQLERLEAIGDAHLTEAVGHIRKDLNLPKE